METTIRAATATDYAAVYALVEWAFAEDPHSDHREQHLVARLRRSEAFVPELSLVAEAAGEIVGYVLLTEVGIRDEARTHPALALAPVAVLPDHQGRGVGAALVTEAHLRARGLDYGVVVLLGHEAYYPRFGYRPAGACGIHFPFAAPAANCMVAELQPGALDGVAGTVAYPSAFFE